jgi:hypothetical protein
MATFDDNFSGDLSAWTQEVGAMEIYSGEFRVTTASWGECNYRYSGAACAGVDQFIKATIATAAGSAFPRMTFRITPSGNRYTIEFDPTLDNVNWFRHSDAGTEEEYINDPGDALTFAQGDVIGVTIV